MNIKRKKGGGKVLNHARYKDMKGREYPPPPWPPPKYFRKSRWGVFRGCRGRSTLK